MIPWKDENPWTIKSIYDLQYFNCPSCVFKDKSKQEFINHAYEIHPEVIDDLRNIKDGSIDDIYCPWNTGDIKIETPFPVKCEIKNEISNYEANDDTFEEFYVEQNIESDIDDLSNNTENKHSNDNEKTISEKRKKENIRLILNKAHQQYVCEKCGKTFDQTVNPKFNLSRHIKRGCYEEKQNNYDCDICSKKFKTLKILDEHVSEVHYVQNGNKNFKCLSCCKVFSQASIVKRHIKKVHEGIKDYKCDICNKVFGYNKDLKRHKESVHEGKDLSVKCGLCNKIYSSRESLLQHLRIDHEGKRSVCEICGKSFRDD